MPPKDIISNVMHEIALAIGVSTKRSPGFPVSFLRFTCQVLHFQSLVCPTVWQVTFFLITGSTPPAGCEQPPPIPNGYSEVINSGTMGTHVQYRCESGFYLVGDKHRNCMKDGNWDGKEPNCTAGIFLVVLGVIWMIFRLAQLQLSAWCASLILPHEGFFQFGVESGWFFF